MTEEAAFTAKSIVSDAIAAAFGNINNQDEEDTAMTESAQEKELVVVEEEVVEEVEEEEEASIPSKTTSPTKKNGVLESSSYATSVFPISRIKRVISICLV